MKKLLSSVLALVMAMSMMTVAFAASESSSNDDEPSYNDNISRSTQVTYTGNGTESYTITVPATMAPGQSASVKVEGTWASNRKLTVTTGSSVTLKNSLDNSTKDVAITFPAFEVVGNNLTAVSKTQNIYLANMTGLFGTWSGSFNYTVSMGAK